MACLTNGRPEGLKAVLPSNFRTLSFIDQHRAIRDLAIAKADAAADGSSVQRGWDEVSGREDAYIQAIKRQGAKRK